MPILRVRIAFGVVVGVPVLYDESRRYVVVLHIVDDSRIAKLYSVGNDSTALFIVVNDTYYDWFCWLNGIGCWSVQLIDG